MKLNEVKVGLWISDANGIYQIISGYDSFHKWYVCKEVLDLDESGNHTLSKDNIYLTKDEMKKCIVL